jgi:4-amino-4-deoxy-L-arabinose transferase-like glycosyltransferase
VVRLAYISGEPYHAINDAGTYNRMASMISTFGDYHTGSGPRSGAGGSRGPTAYFPPAFPYYLAALDSLDGHQAGGKPAVPPERREMAVTGTIAVGFVGLVALEAFGEGVALIALALAAFYPVMIELSGALVAENLVVVLELAAVWAMLRARRARGGRAYVWIAGAGVLTGLCALTHENAILYLLPFGVAAWAIARGRDRPPPRRSWVGRLRPLTAPALLVLMACLTIAPWTIRNAVELHHFVPIADETGITLAGTYNPTSANTPRVPYKWHLFSHVPSLRYLARESNGLTEVELSNRLEAQAFDYIKAHPLAPLEAGFDNTLRMLELEGTYAWHASADALNLHEPWPTIGVYSLYLVGLFALVGAFTRTARRAPGWLWGLPVLWWLSIVFVNVETPRFREPIDPFFLMLAACAISTALARLGAVLGLGGAPVRRGRRAPELASHDTELVKMVQRLT